MSTKKTKEPKVDERVIPLEEIYKTNGLTPRVQMLKDRVREQGVVIAGDRAKYWLESYKETEGEHPMIRRAKAEALLFEKVGIAIRDGELVVGKPTPYSAEHCGVVWARVDIWGLCSAVCPKSPWIPRAGWRFRVATATGSYPGRKGS